MPNRGLSIAKGIAEGAERAAMNIYSINQAKQKLDLERQTVDADVKIKKAQLDKLEILYGPEQIQAEREKLAAETKAQDALFNLRNIQIAKEQSKQKQNLESHTIAMQIFNKALSKGGSLPPGMRINSKGDFSLAGQKADVDTSTLLNETEGGMPADDKASPGKADWWNQ